MRRVPAAVRLVIAGAVLAAMGWTLHRLDLPDVLRRLEGAEPAPLVAAALLVVGPLGVRSLRAIWLFRKLGHEGVPALRMAAVTVFGFSLSSVTPGGSGDLLRAAALAPYGIAARESAGVVVYERVLDVAVMLATFGFALVVTLAPPGVAAAVLGLAAVVCVAAGLAYARLRPGRASIERALPGFARRALPEPATADTLLAPATLARAGAFTLLVFVLEALRPWLVVRALGLEMDVFAAWAVFTLAFLAGLASLLPLGLGSWETAAVWAFGLYDVDPDAGAAAAILMRACVTVPALFAGVIAMALLRSAGSGSQGPPGPR